MGTKTFHYGLRDMKLAVWNGINDWGTAYDVLGARQMTLALEVQTDQLEGDDVVLDRFTKIISATFNFAQAAVDLAVINMITGGVIVSNADYEDVVVGEDDNVPYVGIAARIMSSTYDMHVFAAKAKLAGNLSYEAQYGQYLIPSAQFQAVNEGPANKIFRIRKFVTATALEIPLRTAQGGL